MHMADQELQPWLELAKSVTDEDRVRFSPPPDLWDNIEAEVANAHATGPSSEALHPEAVIDLTARRQTAPSARRKQIRQLVLAGAAAVLALVVVASLRFGDDEPTTTFVADVTNTDMPETFSGSAVATVAVDDSPMLEIDFDGALPSGEPVELWLIKPDLSDMRSLGIVSGDATEWSGVWPADLDPNEYSVVDLSIEPDDGDPTHSGRSILRGQLTIS